MTIAGDVVYAASWSPLHPRATELNGEPLAAVAVLQDGLWRPLPAILGVDGVQSVSAMETDGSNLFVGGTFSSSDRLSISLAQWDGQAWTDISGGFTFDFNIWDIEVVSTDLYVAGEFEAGPDAPANYVARWDGSTWHAVGDDDYPGREIRDLEVHGEVIYTGGSSTYRWENGVWEDLNTHSTALIAQDSLLYIGGGEINLPEAFQPSEGCFIGYSSIVEYVGGAFQSLGTGTYFCKPPDFLGSWGSRRYVYAMERTDKGIYIGGDFTYAGGVPSNYIGYWSFDLANVSTEQERPAYHESTLANPYPNPSANRVASTYSLSEAQHVTITIYNTLGQQIATLVDEMQPVGRHEIQWRASSVPAGIYFMKLTTAAHSEVQKVVVTR